MDVPELTHPSCGGQLVVRGLDFEPLNGFVLLDPDRLDAFCGQGARGGADLLTRFTQTEEGDRVSREGIAVPLLGLEA